MTIIRRTLRHRDIFHIHAALIQRYPGIQRLQTAAAAQILILNVVLPVPQHPRHVDQQILLNNTVRVIRSKRSDQAVSTLQRQYLAWLASRVPEERLSIQSVHHPREQSTPHQDPFRTQSQELHVRQSTPLAVDHTGSWEKLSRASRVQWRKQPRDRLALSQCNQTVSGSLQVCTRI